MGTVLTVSKMDTKLLLEEPVPVVQDSTACGVPAWGWKVGPTLPFKERVESQKSKNLGNF